MHLGGNNLRKMLHAFKKPNVKLRHMVFKFIQLGLLYLSRWKNKDKCRQTQETTGPTTPNSLATQHCVMTQLGLKAVLLASGALS